MEIGDLLQFPSNHVLAGGCIILVIMILSKIGPNFEQLFDRIKIYWISNTIREIKIAFLSMEEDRRAINWLNEQGLLALRLHHWRQRQIFIREIIIEYTTHGKLDKIRDLDKYSLRDWQLMLMEQRSQAWALTNVWFNHYRRKPSSPRIRLDKASSSWKYNTLRNNPIKYLSQQHLVEACKLRDGCCTRACQCCIKPRGQYPDKRLYYAHCTLYCGCCIRSRGFVRHKQGQDFKSVTGSSATPFPIEGAGRFQVL